jgi:hypothetical protein
MLHGYISAENERIESPTVAMEAELFRLRNEIAFLHQRQDSFRAMLSEKNETEDRLRSTVNELQLSLELAKLGHPSPCGGEEGRSPMRKGAGSIGGRVDLAGGASHCATCHCGRSPLKVRRTPPPTVSPLRIPLADPDSDCELRAGVKRLRLEQ